MNVGLRDSAEPAARDDAVAVGDPSEVERGASPEESQPVRWWAAAGFSWTLAGAALVLAGAAVAIAVADGDLFIVSLVPGTVAAALLGGLVAARRPGQPIGVLLCAYGLYGALSVSAFAYAHAAFAHAPWQLPFGKPMMWVTSWDYAPAATLAFVLPQVFPDGRLLSPKWRSALWVTAAFCVLATAGNAFAPGTMGGWFADRPNPYAVHGPFFIVVLDLGEACGLLALLAVVASVTLRWRRSGHLVRQQLKWFLATAPIIAVAVVTFQFFPDALMAGLALGATASLVTAVGIGLAVLRYRLYDIDAVLSRAAVYGLLSVTVAGLYLAVVAAVGGLSQVRSGLSVQVLATVTAAAVLLPVHERLRRRVDRLFFGDRGAPYTAMTRLVRQVEEGTAAEPVLGSVATVVAGSLRLPYAAVQLRVKDEWVPSGTWGPAPADVVAFPLTFQRENVGRLLVGQRAAGERLSTDDERLLTDLARQIAPAAHAVALGEALEASRATLASAREEERRRLRRDLHDGLGPTIAALTLGLDAACAMAANHRDLAELLGRLRAEGQQAVGDVRRIAYGLRPPALDDLGLAGALREEVTRLGRQAAGLSVTLDLPAQRRAGLPAAVEVAAYRIVTEAVTNVLRHSRARRCEIKVWEAERRLNLQVHDDGIGMPEGWRAGVGITAMRERAAELGGELTIALGQPQGTRVFACLPLGGHDG